MRKFDNFCKALENLKEGTKLHEPYSVVEQAGIAGLFGICFEQSWKLVKEILELHGRFDVKIGSPRSVIKTAYQCGMINDSDVWLELLESRNILSHTYSDEESLEIIRKINADYIPALENLKKEIADKWLPETERGLG